jgi:hypothetical protein
MTSDMFQVAWLQDLPSEHIFSHMKCLLSCGILFYFIICRPALWTE